MRDAVIAAVQRRMKVEADGGSADKITCSDNREFESITLSRMRDEGVLRRCCALQGQGFSREGLMA
jgi:hypothetical protein